MRTGLMISFVLLCVTIGLGCWAEYETKQISQRYEAASEELYTLADMEDWSRAEDVIAGYLHDWKQTVPWLQILINHEDIDDITLALERLRACIAAKDDTACYENCAELKENARHIHHRDAFSLGNVL